MKTTSKNPWSKKSKAFSMLTVTKHRTMINLSEDIRYISSKILEINLPPLSMYLVWTHAVFCEVIRDESRVFSLPP